MSRVLRRDSEEGEVHYVSLSNNIMFLLTSLFFAKTNAKIGPIRWMAPESISSKKYSLKSDVWSFGIVGTFLSIFIFPLKVLRPFLKL
jgi:serine/threonine protein kinase